MDLPGAAAAAPLVEKLGGRAGMFKVGSELFTSEGPAFLRYLVNQEQQVFLDLKFHDIPNTVRAAAREVAKIGVAMLDVHASGGSKMMQAALEGAREGSPGRNRPVVLAVTVLTSLASQDLQEIGVTGSSEAAVIRLAWLAQRAGLDGVVASPQEVAAVRRACGPGFVIVTPGIRPASAHADDQVRISTPEKAIQAGADFLVVGRPITKAPDPVAAVEGIVDEIERALASSQGRGTAHHKDTKAHPRKEQ